MDEDNHMYVKIPKDKIVRETDTYIMADLGEAESLLRMCLAAMSNPGQGITRKDGE